MDTKICRVSLTSYLTLWQLKNSEQIRGLGQLPMFLSLRNRCREETRCCSICIFDLQGEFVNLDKIDEEEDLDPVSDDEQIQIRIEDVKPTVPVNINKKGALMTIGSESSIQVGTHFFRPSIISMKESMVTLQTADKSHKSGSIMSMLHKIFPASISQSTSRVNK